MLTLLFTTEAQWQDPWIVEPPPESSAFNYVTVTVNGDSASMEIHEKIPVDRSSPTAIVKYSGM